MPIGHRPYTVNCVNNIFVSVNRPQLIILNLNMQYVSNLWSEYCILTVCTMHLRKRKLGVGGDCPSLKIKYENISKVYCN